MGNCHNKIIVNAPPKTVWDRIINFHDLSWAPNVVKSVENIGDADGRTVGAKRLLSDLAAQYA